MCVYKFTVKEYRKNKNKVIVFGVRIKEALLEEGMRCVSLTSESLRLTSRHPSDSIVIFDEMTKARGVATKT